VIVAILALAGAAPAAAHLSAGPPRHEAAALRRHEATLTEGVSSPGLYDVAVTVAPGTGGRGVVRLLIGSVVRRATAGGRHGRDRITVRLTIRGRTLTVRASSARRIRPHLVVTFKRIPSRTSKPSAPAVKRPGANTLTTVPTPPPAAPPAASASTGPTAASGPTAPPAPPAPTGPFVLPAGFAPVADYTDLVKDYEFSGSGLPADWSTGSGSYGFSATSFQPSQVSLTSSSVSLTAINRGGGGDPYESGWISTAGSYTLRYGMIDFRAKMPAGQGLWSGLWMDSPTSNPGEEIDVQEMLLGNTNIVNGSLHDWAPGWQQLWHETQYTIMAADASQGFLDYQVIWQPGMLTWAVDGVAYAQYTSADAAAAGYPWPFDSSGGVYLVADLAVGGPNDWGGPPNASTAFPASMQIQSVKVWQ